MAHRKDPRQLAFAFAESSRQGADENNLAEFCLGLLSSNTAQEVKTVTREWTQIDPQTGKLERRKYLITAADAFGFPQGKDNALIPALISITRRHGFKSRRVPFTLRELLRELRWEDGGKEYARVRSALDRHVGLKLKSHNAWYDRVEERRSNATFGIIENYECSYPEDPKNGGWESGYFVWGEVFWKSLVARFIKPLDMEFFSSLRSPIAQQLFRLLDRRFAFTREVSFPLRELVENRLGLSANYTFESQLKETLKKPLAELENLGVLKKLGKERYSAIGRGRYLIHFEAGFRYADRADEPTVLLDKPADIPEEGSSRTQLREELSSIGIRGQQADRLLDLGESVVDWGLCELARQQQKRLIESPAPYLEKILSQSAPPEGYVPRHEVSARAEERKASERREAQQKHEAEAAYEAKRREYDHAVESYLLALSESDRVALDAEAERLQPKNIDSQLMRRMTRKRLAAQALGLEPLPSQEEFVAEALRGPRSPEVRS
ncbi:MAG: replication initiator protein A [Dehalococcoidia bacterium]